MSGINVPGRRKIGFEFFGTARLAARCDCLEVEVLPGKKLKDAFALLARAHPYLVGDPLTERGDWVAEGYGVHLEARGFVNDAATPIPEQGNILIISLPAGV